MSDYELIVYYRTNFDEHLIGYIISIRPLCDERVPNGCTNVQHGETVDFEVYFLIFCSFYYHV